MQCCSKTIKVIFVNKIKEIIIMKVEQKKRERIKQIAAEKRLAQKFFLIQAMIMMRMILMIVMMT